MSMIDTKPYGSPKVYNTSTLLACIQCSNIVEQSQLNNAMLCQKCCNKNAVKCKYCRTECRNPKSGSLVCDYCETNLRTHGKPKKCEQCQMLCAFGKPKCARCSYNIKKYGKAQTCEQCHNRAAWEAKKLDNRLLCYPCTESYKKVLGKVSTKVASKSAADGNNNSNANNNSISGSAKRERTDIFNSSRLNTTNESSNGGSTIANGSSAKKSRTEPLKESTSRFSSSLPQVSNSSLLSSSSNFHTSTVASTDLLSSTDNLATVSRLQEKILSLEKQLQAKNAEILSRDVKITEMKAELSKEAKACRERINDSEKGYQNRIQEMQGKINDLNKQVAGLTKKNKSKNSSGPQMPLLAPTNKVDKTPVVDDKTDE